MEAMSVSMSQLCQMVHVAGLRPDIEEHLQLVLQAARPRGLLDNNFVSLFDNVPVSFLDTFAIVKKLADDLDVRLQLTCPGSTMPSTLNGLYGDNLFNALVALQLPYVALENVHLEVALAAQQDTIDIITHVYEKIVHKDYYMPEEYDRTLAFLDRKATLDSIVQKHVELAANAVAPHTSVCVPVH